MNDIASRCIEIIAKSKSIPADSITLASTFDELNIDSLDKINISFEVEEAFHIEIPDDALGTIRTVGDMVEGVTRLQAANPPATTPTSRTLQTSHLSRSALIPHSQPTDRSIIPHRQIQHPSSQSAERSSSSRSSSLLLIVCCVVERPLHSAFVFAFAS